MGKTKWCSNKPVKCSCNGGKCNSTVKQHPLDIIRQQKETK
jgi:hypothetical protein